MPSFKSFLDKVLRKPAPEEQEIFPRKVLMGDIPNSTLAEAVVYIQAWGERYLETPGTAAYYLQAHHGGVLFEVQEPGIGRQAYLPSVLRVLEEQTVSGETSTVRIAAARVLEIQKQPDNRLAFLLMPESYESRTTAGVRDDGPKLVPLRQNLEPLEKIGKFLVGLGIVAVILGLGFRVLVPNKEVPKAILTSVPLSVFSLPISKWQTLENYARKGLYIREMLYQRNTWQVIPGTTHHADSPESYLVPRHMFTHQKAP
jgi:hypothetical protein